MAKVLPVRTALQLTAMAASLALGACSMNGTHGVVAKGDSSYDRLMTLARQVEQRGDRATAQTLYWRAAQQPNSGFEAWNKLGMLKLASGDTQGAEEAYQQALGLAPDAPDVQLGLATAQLRLGFADRAQPLLATAVPQINTAAAYTRLGIAEALLGHTEAAQAALLSANNLAPADLDGRCNLAIAYALNNEPTLALNKISGLDKDPSVKPSHQRNVLLVHVLVGRAGEPAAVQLDGVSPRQRQQWMRLAKSIAAMATPAQKANAMGLVDNS